MKLLFDSNVLISAAIATGHCTVLVARCAKRHQLVTCEFILNEVIERLTGKFDFPAQFARTIVDVFAAKMRLVTPDAVAPSECRDPNDAPVLGAALAGGCRCIVTGDKDLLTLGRFRKIDIISPTDFWRYEAKHGG